LVYDLGAHNGDDADFYLRQGFRVVAVEANPSLAAGIETRFAAAIAAGRLTVVGLAVTADTRETIGLWIDDENDALSTVLRPPTEPGRYRESIVGTIRLPDLVARFGDPLYLKIDLEGLDQDVLAELFAAGLRPPYLSAEMHSIEPFCQMVGAGYRHFKIVEGACVNTPLYGRAARTWDGATLEHAFPWGASGPWGEDIPGPWLNADDTFAYLAEYGLGWKDVHAAWAPA
jgi:FkbM family methyltransferase